MSENVLITLIVVVGIALVLIVALWMFKKNGLDKFNLKANKNGVDASMEKLPKANGVNIRRSIQLNGSEIEVTKDNVNIEEILQDKSKMKVLNDTTQSNSDN
jgi:FtsZ-interacting cell division protein ZipA